MFENIVESFGSVLGNAMGGAAQGAVQSLGNPKDPGTIDLGFLGQLGGDLIQHLTRDLEQMEIKTTDDLKPGQQIFHVQIDDKDPKLCQVWSATIKAINPQNKTFYLSLKDPNTKLARARENNRQFNRSTLNPQKTPVKPAVNQNPVVVTAGFIPSFDDLIKEAAPVPAAPVPAAPAPAPAGPKTTDIQSLKELLDRKDLYVFYKDGNPPVRPGIVYEPVPMKPGDLEKIPFGPATNYIKTWYKISDQNRVLGLYRKNGIQSVQEQFFPKMVDFLAGF